MRAPDASDSARLQAGGRSRLAQVFSCLCLLSCFDTPGYSQDQSIRVRLIEVPVRVESGGAPLRGLSKDSFRLAVDGKQVSIHTLEEFDSQTEDPAGQVPAAARRSFLFLFDRSLTETTLVDRARSAAVSFVLDERNSNALMSVATYTSAHGVKTLAPFTTDRRQVIQAISTLQVETVAQPADPLGLVVAAPSIAQKTFEQADETPPTAPKRARRPNKSRLSKTQREGEASHLLQSLTSLATQLEPLTGHKHLVLFSRGFEADLLFGEERPYQDAHAFERVRDAYHDPSDTYGSQAIRSIAEAMALALSAADCSIEAVDLGSIGASSSNGTDALRYLSQETGGTLLTRRSLKEALGTLAESTQHSYLLTFDPTGAPTKKTPRARSIAVAIADAPRAKVTHRPTYTERSEAGETPSELARRAIAGRAGGPMPLHLRVLPATESPAESLLVPLALEIPGQQLLAQADSSSVHGRNLWIRDEPRRNDCGSLRPAS